MLAKHLLSIGPVGTNTSNAEERPYGTSPQDPQPSNPANTNKSLATAGRKKHVFILQHAICVSVPTTRMLNKPTAQA